MRKKEARQGIEITDTIPGVIGTMATKETEGPGPKLGDVSDDELRAELDRRARLVSDPPPSLPSPDFTHLRELIAQGVADASQNKIWMKDFKQYVYEAAMEAVYGPNFWTWINAVEWDGGR